MAAGVPAGTASVQRLLEPRSIAIVGASTDPDSISGRPLRFLREHGYPGRVYPVNPRHRSVLGVPAYASIAEVPEPVDLALIAVPARAVPPLVAACARAGVGTALVLSAGFADGDGSGRDLERELARIVAGTDLRVLGPNSEG